MYDLIKLMEFSFPPFFFPSFLFSFRVCEIFVGGEFVAARRPTTVSMLWIVWSVWVVLLEARRSIGTQE